MDPDTPDPETLDRLKFFFHRNGYVRWPRPERLEDEPPEKYKKGAEVRLVAETHSELTEIRILLRKAGFRPGSHFPKGNQFRQPIYGYQQVARFLRLMDDERGSGGA